MGNMDKKEPKPNKEGTKAEKEICGCGCVPPVMENEK